MIIDEKSSVYNNIPENAVGVSKELSMIELMNLLDKYNETENWRLVGYWNKLQCAINRGYIEKNKTYEMICNIIDRERAIFVDRVYYRDNK